MAADTINYSDVPEEEYEIIQESDLYTDVPSEEYEIVGAPQYEDAPSTEYDIVEFVEGPTPDEDRYEVKAPEDQSSFVADALRGAGQTMEDIGQVYPALETAATWITSLYGLPLSGLMGLLSLPAGVDTSKKVIEKAQELLIYQPQTKRGQRLLEASMYPLAKWQEVAAVGGEKMYE